MVVQVKRGDVFFADLNPTKGSEQGGTRPVLVIQNDIGNKYSATVVVAAITGKENKKSLPTHIRIETEFLPKFSFVLLEQIRTIDKSRIKKYIGSLDKNMMQEIDKALYTSVGLSERGSNDYE